MRYNFIYYLLGLSYRVCRFDFYQQIFVNLFMILKRFLTLSFFSRPKLAYRGTFTLASGKKKQPVVDEPVVQQNAQEAPAVTEEVQTEAAQGETVQAEGVQSEAVQGEVQHNAGINRAENQYHRYRQQPDDEFAVSEFLIFRQNKAQQMNALIEQMKQVTNKQDFQKLLSEYNAMAELQKLAPLQEYEKKLNFSPDTFVPIREALAPAQPSHRAKRYDMRNLKYMTISGYSAKEIRELYVEGAYGRLEDSGFVPEIVKLVTADPSRSFLLNLVYQAFTSTPNPKTPPTIPQPDLQKLLESLTSNQLPQTNPLKLLYLTSKLNPESIPESAPFMLRELNTLSIRGQSVRKQLKALTHFYFNERACSRIVGRIVKGCRSLEELLRVWFLGLVVLMRVRDLELAGWDGKRVCFNDVFQLLRGELLEDVFLSHIPQILYQQSTGKQYEIYKKAMQTHHENPKTITNIPRSTFEKTHKISLLHLQNTQNTQKQTSTQNLTQIVYSFPHDPIDVRANLSGKREKRALVGDQQYRVVEDIIAGRYESALGYYMRYVVEEKEEIQEVNRLLVEAKCHFYDRTSQALYVLKQIFKDCSSKLEQENFRLLNSEVEALNGAHENVDQEHDQEGQEEADEEGVEEGQEGVKENVRVARQNHSKRTTNQTQKVKQGVFSKKPVSQFSSAKDKFNPETPLTPEQSTRQYENYLKTVKQTESSLQVQPEQSKLIPELDFNSCRSIEEIQKEFQRHLAEINGDNVMDLLNRYQNVPIIENFGVLLKYYLLSSNPVAVKGGHVKGLNVEFTSTFGEVSKDYGEYLKNCAIMFELPNNIYEELLDDQITKCQRQHFKRIVAHLFLFKEQIPDSIINKICKICSKEKIGLTLLEIINLLNVRGLEISYESLKTIAASIQNFKNMETDLIQFIRKYCDRSGLPIETQLFEPYITNLTFTQRYESLNEFLQLLRQEFKPKEYKINPKISAEENIKAEKVYKEKQAERLNRELFEMIKIVSGSLKPRTTIPSFIPELFDLYMSKKKGETMDREYGVGLIVNSQNEDKFLDLLAKLKADQTQNNQIVFEALIKCLTVFGKNLKDKVQKILHATLFEKRYDLTEEHLKSFGFIFKELDTPGAYLEFLEYVLKTQPKMNQDIKNLYYRVFNQTTDDYSKNQMSGLLDFIFNPAKEKERAEYKRVKIEEERKYKILQSMGAKKETKPDTKAQEAKGKEGAAPEKKKTKKELKKDQKKLKEEQGKSGQKSDKKKDAKSVEKAQKQVSLEVKSPAERKLKRYQKGLAKVASTFTYDQNKKIIYNPKLSKIDMRRQGTIMFVENFMSRFEVNAEQDLQDKKKSKQSKQAKGAKVAKKN